MPVDLALEMTGLDFSDDVTFIIGLGLAMPAATVAAIWRISRRDAALTALFFIANFYISLTIYGLSGRHFGLWSLLLIGTLWTEIKSGPIPSFVLAMMILMGASGVVMGLKEWTEPFSSAPLTANALREAQADKAMVATVGILLAADVHGTLQIPTYDIPNKCMQTFIRWRMPKVANAPTRGPMGNENRIGVTTESIAELKKVAARTGGRLFLLLDFWASATLQEIDDPSVSYVAFVGRRNPKHQWRYIFRLDVPSDPDPAPIPPCTR